MASHIPWMPSTTSKLFFRADHQLHIISFVSISDYIRGLGGKWMVICFSKNNISPGSFVQNWPWMVYLINHLSWENLLHIQNYSKTQYSFWNARNSMVDLSGSCLFLLSYISETKIRFILIDVCWFWYHIG